MRTGSPWSRGKADNINKGHRPVLIQVLLTVQCSELTDNYFVYAFDHVDSPVAPRRPLMADTFTVL
jgi:hypothetical protein